MPGLVGFTGVDVTTSERVLALEQMRELLRHESFYTCDELFNDGDVCATRVSTGIVQTEPQPTTLSGIHVWLDGEFYNQAELGQAGMGARATDSALLGRMFEGGTPDDHLLRCINGVFSGVVYDSRRRRLHLVCDRHGLRPLYWTRTRHGVAWATESKAFLALPQCDLRVDPVSVQQFLAVGYLLGNRAWFEGVELVPPGTVLTWDIAQHVLAKRRYWWWDRIEPTTVGRAEDELADEVGLRFRQAVERRCRATEGLGVFLSGGLDSRAIVAAIPTPGEEIETLTFGQRGCTDARIARAVARVKGAKHSFWEITAENWLAPRLRGVWFTEGQYSILHMHGIEARERVRQLFRVNINGFAGDLILGASYLHEASCLDRVIPRYVAGVMGCDPELLTDLDSYRSLGKCDYYFLDNRVRRFTLMGTVNWMTVIHDRHPFLDNDLIELVYSLPDRQRFQNRLYSRMLLRTFPAYFRTIPWQKTGVPISYPHIVQRGIPALRRRLRALAPPALVGRFRMLAPDGYTDYPSWLRAEPARSLSSTLLCDDDAAHLEFVPRGTAPRLLEEHWTGLNHAETIGRLLTLEIWLRQAVRGQLRSGVSRP